METGNSVEAGRVKRKKITSGNDPKVMDENEEAESGTEAEMRFLEEVSAAAVKRAEEQEKIAEEIRQVGRELEEDSDEE